MSPKNSITHYCKGPCLESSVRDCFLCHSAGINRLNISGITMDSGEVTLGENYVQFIRYVWAISVMYCVKGVVITWHSQKETTIHKRYNSTLANQFPKQPNSWYMCLIIPCLNFCLGWQVFGASTNVYMHGWKESGMVQWLSVEACDRQMWVRFPAPGVIPDLVVVCHSS